MMPLALVIAATGCGNKSETSGSTTTTSTGGQGGAGASTPTGGSGGEGGAVCQPETEICDGKDNDCNGVPDDVANLPGGCKCTDGTTQSCYSGADGTAGVGTCVTGMQACVNGAWAECVGQITPSPEKCNLTDDDCNGTVDDMGVATCGVGACQTILEKCVNGVTQPCVPGQPTTEVCDGVDNNCNGLTDESDPMNGSNCLTGLQGPCTVGKMSCDAGAPTCVPDVMPTDEACDGVDNDCNGTVDDNVVGTGADCTTALPGPCTPGKVQCQNQVVDCVSNVQPINEVCGDNVDNDCNGIVDDIPGLNGVCDTGLLGACKDGTLLCQAGSTTCMQTTFAAANDPCDGIDNDCDGVTDPGCLYTFTGVAANVPVAALTGWTQCYIDNYANASTPMSTILAQCNKANLLMACRVAGSSVLQLAAHAPRIDVITDTGTGNVTHNANGVGWYYNNSWSWGFAVQGDAVIRNSCDVGGGVNSSKRMCWHSGGGNINSGYRCGDSYSFGGDYERIVYHAN
jgi:hypothetical protein